MPYVTTPDNVRIHYEIEGSGIPLVLQHGFTDSLMTWYERGYVDMLKHNYRLVLIDARGHHLSDKPRDESSYGLEYFAQDVVAVLDALDIPKAHYLGYSMGGLIGYALGRDAPNRFSSMILGGASPYRFPSGAEDVMMPVLLQGAPAVRTFFEGYFNPAFEKRLDENDMDALIACRKRRFRSLGFEHSLANMTMPCLLYAGDADPVLEGMKSAAAAMPNAQFFSLPGYGHVQAMMEIQSVIPRIMQFLDNAMTA